MSFSFKFLCQILKLSRLINSLERERTLVLAEKGAQKGDEMATSQKCLQNGFENGIRSEKIEKVEIRGKVSSDIDVIHAKEGFQFIGTMNPGGDYGKKGTLCLTRAL